MRFLSRVRVAVAVVIGQALWLPAVAGAVPIAFQFTGVVTDAGDFAPQLAVGDPFTATLSYDTDLQRGNPGFTIARYGSGFALEIQAGGFTWTTPAFLDVWEDGTRFSVEFARPGEGILLLEGLGLIPTGGGLPTSFDLSLATIQHVVRGRGPSQFMEGNITATTQVQTSAPIPEPATLTLMTLGLAALAARSGRNTGTSRTACSRPCGTAAS